MSSFKDEAMSIISNTQDSVKEPSTEEASLETGGDPNTIAEEPVVENETTEPVENPVTEEQPEESDSEKSEQPEKHKVKIRGEEKELTLDEMKTLASKAGNTEQKNAEINKMKRDLELKEKQWISFMSDPKQIVQYALDNGVEIGNLRQPESERGKDLPEEELFEINEDDEFDEEKIELKKTMNEMHKRMKSMESHIYEQQDNNYARNMENEFMEKSQKYGIPNTKEAQEVIMSTFRMNEPRYREANQIYTLDHAMVSYIKALPKMDDFINALEPNDDVLGLIEKNEKLNNAIYKRSVEKYNVDSAKRAKETKIPSTSAKNLPQEKKIPPIKAKSFKEYGDILKGHIFGGS